MKRANGGFRVLAQHILVVTQREHIISWGCCVAVSESDGKASSDPGRAGSERGKEGLWSEKTDQTTRGGK